MAVYEYSFITVGPNRHIEVYKDNVLIFKGNSTFSATNDVLKQEAILNLQNSEPGVEGMTLKTSLVSTVDISAAVPVTTPVPTPVSIEPLTPPVIPPAPEPIPQPEIKAPAQPMNVFTPQNTAPPKPPSEKQGTTYRIVTIFEKTIELDELSIPARDTSKSKEKQKLEDSISIEFPLIKINEYIFNRSEIRSVSIDCTDFLPKIMLNIVMLSQLFLAKEMPKDGDVISLAIRNKNDVLKIIRNDYVITSVHVIPNSTQTKSPVMMTLFGELFVPGLKSQKNDFSFQGTSFDALRNFAQKFKLGFASNENNTDDNQIWLKANMAGDVFITNITERAWKDTDSFFQCWIDVYYNLNFINMNKQMISAETEVDTATLISNVDSNFIYGANTDESKTVTTAKVFSNFINFRTTPFFITSWNPINKSSAITFQYGTKIACGMFEHNQNLYQDPSTQKYWSILTEPTYDKQKVNKFILLRGRAAYVKDASNPELVRANYNYPDLYQRAPWLGVQYTISNPTDDNSLWDGNHHKNYQLAKIKNLINNKELDKLNVVIEVTGNNFNIIRGDKTPIALIRTDAVDNTRINPNIGFRDALDLFYSGWYVIKGFTLAWTSKNEETSLSNFTQQFILTRREWPTPIPVDPIKTSINK